jgi:hypothetical protein
LLEPEPVPLDRMFEAIDRRLLFIQKTVDNHLKTEHPQEYADAMRLAGEEAV